MKKLLSVFGMMLCLHSITTSPSDLRASSITTREKQLVKALTALVNSEAGKREQLKRIYIPAAEAPLV